MLRIQLQNKQKGNKANAAFQHLTEQKEPRLPGEDRQQPVLPLVSKHLSDILLEAQREAVLIRACPKDWCSERLCREEETQRDTNGQMRQTQTQLNNQQEKF